MRGAPTVKHKYPHYTRKARTMKKKMVEIRYLSGNAYTDSPWSIGGDNGALGDAGQLQDPPPLCEDFADAHSPLVVKINPEMDKREVVAALRALADQIDSERAWRKPATAIHRDRAPAKPTASTYPKGE